MGASGAIHTPVVQLHLGASWDQTSFDIAPSWALFLTALGVIELDIAPSWALLVHSCARTLDIALLCLARSATIFSDLA